MYRNGDCDPIYRNSQEVASIGVSLFWDFDVLRPGKSHVRIARVVKLESLVRLVFPTRCESGGQRINRSTVYIP